MNHEHQVLGAMLAARSAIEDAAGILTGTDFADARHESIFEAILDLDSDGKPVDPLSVHDALTESGQRADLAYLHQLHSGVVTASSAEYYAHQVRADSLRRAVRKAGSELQSISEAEDALEAVNAARAALDKVADKQEAETVSNEQAVYEAIDSIDAPKGIPTPWATVNNVIRGWSPGMLYIAGARPGVGKSVLAVGALLDAARRGDGVAVMASLEMPRDELYLRVLSSVGDVHGERIQHNRLTKDDDNRLRRAAATVAPLPILVDDRTGLSIAQLRAVVRQQQRQRDVSVVIVDYLGIMTPPAGVPRSDRRVQVDAIAQGLKNLARDLRVPIIALAQLNRAIEGRTEKTPTLSDLRESGGIEAAADCVLLMHRSEEEPNDLHINVAKNRHGPRAHLTLNFRGEFSRIEDIRTAWGAA